MAERAELKAAPRSAQGKGAARRLRREGLIPAVIYGRDEETQSLTVDAHEFEHLIKEVSVENTLIDLSIEGRGDGPVKTLVGEVQLHPFKPQVLHIDFKQIHVGERVQVEIAIRLVGNPEGVKEGGVLQHVLHDLPIECVAEEIPESFEVDVSSLVMGDSIHVSDLDIPEGVEVLVDLDRTVCVVQAPTVLVLPEEEEELEEGLEPELIGELEEGEEAEAEGEAAEAEGEEKEEE